MQDANKKANQVWVVKVLFVLSSQFFYKNLKTLLKIKFMNYINI